MRARMQELEQAMARDQNPPRQVLAEYDRLSAEFTRRGGYEMDRLRNTVANGLGIPTEQRRQLFAQLSGGEKTRMNLARLILEDTDVYKRQQYSRPENWNGRHVPEILLSGDHAKVARWRRKQSIIRTRLRRPDMYKKLEFTTKQDQKLLAEIEEELNDEKRTH